MKDYSTVIRWLNQVSSSRGRSVSTERTYLHFLRRYCKFMNKTPDEIIAEKREHTKSDDIFQQRAHDEGLILFQQQLSTTLAPGSVATGIAIIKSFYSANYSALLQKAPQRYTTRERSVPTLDQLRRMVRRMKDPMYKAIILFLAQSGQGLDEFKRVTYKQISKELKKGVSPLHIGPILREKTKIRYDFFIGQDTINALKKYLEEYQVRGKQPLFRFSKRWIEEIVRKSCYRILNPHTTPHKLRTFFIQNMKKGAPEIYVEYWAGHVLPYRGAYFQPAIADQRPIYAQHEHLVSITPPDTTTK